eukprot:Hpha_TRINITY_DN16121_c1_g6::TRINITY_DN16121_c1_g6_i1::g.4171::m.4171/K08515/VAMP7; vesicle-associated membrane protein 7
MGDNNIRYAAVYSRGQIVGEHPAKEFPKYAEVVRKVAEKESKNPQYGKCRLRDDSTGTFINTFSTGDGMFFACVASTAVEARRTFGLLARMETAFRSSGAKTEVEAGKEVKKQIDWVNNPENDKLLQAQKLVEETKGVMLQNMDDMLNRGERLEEMMQKTDELQNDARTFQRKAATIRRQACWEDYKTRIMLACIVLTVLFIIVLIFCKPNFKDCS